MSNQQTPFESIAFRAIRKLQDNHYCEQIESGKRCSVCEFAADLEREAAEPNSPSPAGATTDECPQCGSRQRNTYWQLCTEDTAPHIWHKQQPLKRRTDKEMCELIFHGNLQSDCDNCGKHPNEHYCYFGSKDNWTYAKAEAPAASEKPKWNRQESCSECDGDGCGKCDPEKAAYYEAMTDEVLTNGETRAYDAGWESAKKYFTGRASEGVTEDGNVMLAEFGKILAAELEGEWGTYELDGCDCEEILMRVGLIEQVTMKEACGEDCACAGLGDFPMQCNRTTELGKKALKLAEGK